MGNLQDLRALRAFIFDMDGVIYRGHEVVPGATEFIANLRQAGIPFIYLTNNSSTPPDKVALRLADMGIPATASEVLTSADVTAAEVSRAVTGRQALVVGEEGIRSALARCGFTFVDDHRDADVVVVGIDRQTTYARLREAALAIRRGAPFFATNTDRTLPTEAGLVPGAGAIVGFLQIATDVQPTVLGKPSPGIFHYALRSLGTDPEATATIGDRSETDILGGQRAGLSTIAVLSGAGTAEDFAAMQPPPDWVFPSLAELNLAYFW
jgi:4-nitrophenyl phosphatase